MILRLAALGVLLLAAGCSRHNPGTSLTIWHTKSGQERKLLESALADYQKVHPEVRVEALNRDPEELRNLYVIAAVAGQGPDLVYGAADNVGVFVTTQTIQPLEAAMPAGFVDRFTSNGVVAWNGTNWLAADKVGDHLMLIYNRKLVPHPPATLSELITTASTLTTNTPGGRQYGLVWNYVEPFFFVPFLTGFGAWMMDDAGHPTLDNPATAAAIQFVLDLRDKHKAIPAETDYTISDSLFKEGKAAMIINGPWAWPDYKLPDFAMIAPLPINDLPGFEGLPCRPIIAANGYCLNVNLKGERRAAAAALLDYLTSRGIQERMSRELRTFPSDRAYAESDEVRNDPVLSISGRQIAAGIPMPVRPQLRQIWDGMRGPYQRVMQGGVSARDGARLMQHECEKLIKDAQL